MGKTKNKRDKIMKQLANLYRIDDAFQHRYNAFLKDLEVALAANKKKERRLLLDRLADELNGYCARINQAVESAKKIYDHNTPEIKSFKNLDKDLASRFYDDVQASQSKVLDEDRNKGCHPDPYYFNTNIINKNEEILGLIKNSIQKLESLDNFQIDELSLLREKDNQSDNMERKIRRFIITNINKRNIGNDKLVIEINK